jgi:hypothetical protein
MANADQPGTALAPRVQAFHTRMLERAGLSHDRASDVMAQQGEKILSANTIEEIWTADAGGTIQCRDVPGTVWQINTVEPVPSNRTDIENSTGYYITMDATYLGGPKDVAAANALTIGQNYALQTGAELIVFKVVMFEAAEALPIRAMIVGITTASGRTVLKLAEPPEMAQPGTAE